MAAVVADVWTTLFCSNSTRAPLIGVPGPLCVTVPLTVPVPTPNVTALLAPPSTVMMTGPVVAPAGTMATICVSVQLVAAAATPLKVSVLASCATPKAVPSMVTVLPMVPDDGDKRLIAGCVKEKFTVVGWFADTGFPGLRAVR